MNDTNEKSRQPLRQLSIRQGLLLAFGVLLGLSLLICVAAWLFYDELEQDLELMSAGVLPQVVRSRNLVLASNNLSSFAGKMAYAAELGNLKRLEEFSRQASLGLQRELKSTAEKGTDATQIVQLQQIYLQTDQNLQQLAVQVEQKLTLTAAADRWEQEFLRLSDELIDILVAAAQRAETQWQEERLFLEGLNLLHRVERAVTAVGHIDVPADIGRHEEVLIPLLKAVEKVVYDLLQRPIDADFKLYLVKLKELVEGENSFLNQRRQLLVAQARIGSLLSSSNQLSAQFRLLTTVMVKRSSQLVVEVRNEALEDIAQRKWFMSVMMLLSVGLSFALIWYVGHRRMVRPLSELSQAVTSLGDGKLPLETGSDGVWEIQELGLSFRAMAETISQRNHDLRQLQLLLRNVIDSLSHQLIAVDRNCRLILWNFQVEKSSAEPLVEGAPVREVFSWLPVDFTRIEQAVMQRQALLIKQLTLVQDEQPRNYELSCVPLRDEVHQGAVLRIEDVTERLRIEKTIAQSEKMLSVGGLAAGIAHEINNPLAGIMQSAQVLDTRLNSTLPRNIAVAEQCGLDLQRLDCYLEQRKIKSLLLGVRSSASQAAKIVKNMLAFSRGGSTAEASRFELLDLVTVVEDTVALLNTDYDLRQGYDFRQIKIEREYAKSLPLVSCEGALIQQVIFNILKNCAQAIDRAHSEQSEPRINISLIQDLGGVKLSIEDNGPGMTEEVQQRIFEPFYTTRETGKGTGLGMSVSYFIITDYHQGTFAVESQLGQGSKFIIGLPLESELAV